MKIIFPFVLILFIQCKTTETNQSKASLENTYWKLSEVNGMPVETPPNAKEVHMILVNADGEKRIKGFAGCNGLGGDYTTDGNKINFSVITTKIFCEEQMETENILTQSLTDANRYEIKGETLELYQDDTFLIKFQSIYLK